MLKTLFRGLFDSDLTTVISLSDFLLCLATALFLGLMLALSYMTKGRCTKSFLITLSVLPAVVCIVIMMVNGNIGAGVAVAGAFSLIRFRSVPGTGEEICTLFLAMGAGLICGMGYLAFAALFTLIMCAVFVLYQHFDFGFRKKSGRDKTLRITIPENLDYTGVFDDIFHQYTSFCELVQVKSTNLGSLFRLTYQITLRDAAKEKEMIDQIRCRNGNLEITLSRQENASEL